MKFLKLASLTLFCLFLSVQLQAQPDAKTVLARLSWVTGTWERTNNTKANRSQTETWERSDNGYTGKYVTLINGDTAFVEKFSLIIKDKAVFYVAHGPKNSSPVYFRLTGISETGFVAENPANEFPKKVTYRRTKDNLTTVITDDYSMQEYVFKLK